MPSYFPCYKLTFRQTILALLFYLVLLIIYRYEAILKITTHYLGTDQYDGGLYVWLFTHNLNLLSEYPYFNTHAFYPYTKTLAWTDNYCL